jgi:enoyl-CoA hydratase
MFGGVERAVGHTHDFRQFDLVAAHARLAGDGQITIGAIEGFCIGGGVALAVALDFRVMARDGHLRVPEIGLGMNMSWQSVPRMLHLIGPARTKQAVILADQRISAAEAYEWGLVEEVADPGKAFDAAMALATKVAAQPPLSVAMTKLTVNRLAHALDTRH